MTKGWRALSRRLRFAVQALFATGVIALGVLAGLTQLAMPWLQHHPQHVEHWLSARLDRSVRIGHLSGAWVGGGPLLSLDDVEIGAKDAGQAAFKIPHAELVFDLYALFQRNSALTEFRIAGLDLQLINDAGAWQLHGLDFGSPQATSAPFSLGALGALEIRGLKLSIDDPARGLHVALAAPVLRLINHGSITRVAGRVRGADSDVPPLDLVANLDINRRSGEIYVGGLDVELARLLAGHTPQGVQLIAGRGIVQLWVKIGAGRVDDLRVRTDLADARFGATTPIVLAGDPAVTPHIAFDRLAFVARWLRDAHGWTFDVADFSTDHDTSNAQARLTVEGRDDGAGAHYRAGVGALPLEPLGSLAMLVGALSPGLRQWLYTAHPRGTLVDADLRWNGSADFEIHADLRDVDIASAVFTPGVEHADFDVQGDAEALQLHIPTQAARIDYPRIFRKPFLFSQLGGDVIVRRAGNGWRLATDQLVFEGVGYGGELRGGVNLRGDGKPPFVDLYAVLTHADVVATKLFLPTLTMPPQAIAWLDRALVGGHLAAGRIALRGDLADWPFHNLAGRMVARGDVADLTLDYDPHWPRAEHVHAIANFINDGMQVDVDAATSMGNRLSQVSASIADFGPLVLDLDAKGTGSGANLLNFLRATPIGKRYQDQLKDIAISGTGAVAFTLNLPIKQIEALKLDGSVDLSDAKLDHNAFNLHFIDASGKLRFNQKGFAADALDVSFRGHQAKLDIAIGDYVTDPKHTFEAALDGVFPASDVFADVPVLLPALVKFPGEARWIAQVAIDASDNATGLTHFGLASDLRGITIDLPAPLAKSADAALPFRLDLDLPYAGQLFRATIGDVVAVDGRIPGPGRAFAASVGFGAQAPAALPVQGIVVRGRVVRVDAGGWLDLAVAGGGGPGSLVRGIDVHADDFAFADRHFPDMHVAIDNAVAATTMQLDSDALAGRLTIPKMNLASGITAKFARIHWPEAPPNAPDTSAFADVAPGSLPPLHIRVDDFRLGQSSFGSAEFDSHPVTNGMRIEKLESHSPNVTMSASGDWTGSAADNHSHLLIDLSAQNLGRMMDALGFTGLIDGGATHSTIDGVWAGPPTAFALSKLDGTLDISVAEGRIPDVHPGAGRIFGLLSLTEIPRRLSLDFSDFFQSGFSFNSIVGKFRLSDGNAYTDGITIKSPAAEIVVTGRTGLRAKDYDQQMNVSPHAGSALPIVGAIAAGPVGAAAGLVMQSILKKPLGEVVARRYHVTGSWDKPEVTLEKPTTRNGAPGKVAPRKTLEVKPAPPAATDSSPHGWRGLKRAGAHRSAHGDALRAGMRGPTSAQRFLTTRGFWPIRNGAGNATSRSVASILHPPSPIPSNDRTHHPS